MSDPIPSRWRRPAIVGVAVACVALVPLAVGTPTRAQTAPPPPNVIVLVTDDQPADTWDAMPNVRDRIAGEGVRFTEAYVSNPMCCPSRAAILTGGYSHTTGVYTNGGSSERPSGAFGGFRAFYEHGNEQRTMARYLDPTYETGLFGKYMNGYPGYVEDVLGLPGYVPPGWDEWQAFYERNGRYLDYDLNVNGEIVGYGSTPEDFSTDVIGERFLDWLDPSDGDGRDPSSPFFAYVAPFAPHLPAEASTTFGDGSRFTGLPAFSSPALNEDDVGDKPTYLRRLDPLTDTQLAKLDAARLAQWRSIYSFDRQVGAALDYLEAAGLLEDTVIVFLSDNGLAGGEHRWRSKQVPYERSVRVPFAIRFDAIDGGASVDDRTTVLNVDIAPTVMALVSEEGTPPIGFDGASLVDAITGRQRTVPRDAILLEGMYVRSTRRSTPTYCGIVADGWKYVVYSPTRKDPSLVEGDEDSELYDLRNDPFELENLAATEQARAVELRMRLAELCDPPPPRWRVAW